MSALFRNRFKPDSRSDSTALHSVTASGDLQVTDGDLKYVGQQGGNNAPVGYQEASGAPVETKSPLGYAVGPVTILFLNLSKMVGTGIFSTRNHPLSNIPPSLTPSQPPPSSPAPAPSASA